MSEEKLGIVQYKNVYCFICKRRLRGLRSRSKGVGPTCAKKNPDRVARHLAEFAGQQALPYQKDSKSPEEEVYSAAKPGYENEET